MNIGKDIVLTNPDGNGIVLQSIHESNIDQIRVWKNANREYFFHKDLISFEQQKRWFSDFSSRLNDVMFIVNYKGQNVGCMGFRLLNNKIDIYNVILGEKVHERKGIMSRSLRMMLEYIDNRYNQDISAKVLPTNPSVRWYKKNGFEIENTCNDYYMMRFIKSSMQDT